MQLSKRINWDDPDTLLYARVGYYSAQVLVIGMAYALMYLIQKRNDTRPLRYVPQAQPSFSNPNPPADGEAVNTTNVEYDVSQVKQFIQSTLSSILMISAMHWYFKFTQPLVLQSVLPVKNLLTHKVALIHLWGDAPEGDLKRPFKTESPFGALFGAAGGNESTAETPAPVDDGHAKKE
ncbi:inorganic phosphate transporter Pho88 [Fennellomyces sp. T-0311]|nr:inorganic phosphate transporter Pho88 [Fennellomyces sp. T-0311]